LSTTARPLPESLDPTRLTFRYTRNEDGWVTAQIVEFPAAISEGPSEHVAMANVLDALYDLTHTPTFTERLVFGAQARIVEPIEALIGSIANHLRRGPKQGTRDGHRDHVH
jgi:hypothetical protein